MAGLNGLLRGLSGLFRDSGELAFFLQIVLWTVDLNYLKNRMNARSLAERVSA